MTGKRLPAQFDRRLGKRDQVADAHQFRDFAAAAGRYPPTGVPAAPDHPALRRAGGGRRAGQPRRAGANWPFRTCPAWHLCQWHTRDRLSRAGRARPRRRPGDAQETIRDAGDHQADAVHVGGNHHGGRGCAVPVPRRSPCREPSLPRLSLVDQRPPFVCDDFGGRILVAGKTGGGEQFFEKGEEFCHGGFGLPQSKELELEKAFRMGAGVSEGVGVGVKVGVGVRVGSGVKVGVSSEVGVSIGWGTGGRVGRGVGRGVGGGGCGRQGAGGGRGQGPGGREWSVCRLAWQWE